MTPLLVTYEQGNLLLQHVNLGYQAKFNDETKFASDVRATFDRNARQLFKGMKKVSPGFQATPKIIPVFGDPDNWKEHPKRMIRIANGQGGFQEIVAPGQPDADQFDLVDSTKTITLDLNAQARDAVAMILLKLSHPDSPDHLSAAGQDQFVWPLAEQLKIVPWLEGKVGIGKAAFQVDYSTEESVEKAAS